MKKIIFLSLMLIINNIHSKTDDSKIVEEFKKKLLNEQEIQKELKKQSTLTEDDFKVLEKKKLEEDIEREKNKLKETLNDSIGKDADLLAKEKEDKKKKEEQLKKEKLEKEEQLKKEKLEKEKLEKEDKKKKEKENKEKNDKNLDLETIVLEEEKPIIEDDKNNKKTGKTIQNDKNDKEFIFGNFDENKNNNEIFTTEGFENTINMEIGKDEFKSQDSGIEMKTYDITDTDVSIEYLYSEDYENLILNKPKVKKNNIKLGKEIPIIAPQSKNLVNFNTTDIPDEIKTYNRTVENKHIPTITTAEDLFIIAIQAVYQNDLALLRSLVEKTKDPDFLVENKYTLLNLSVKNHRFDLIKFLIYNGSSINKQDLNGNTSLHLAILNYDYKIIKFLISNGSKVDIQNENGDTAAMLALKLNHDNLCIELIKEGTNLNIKNIDGDNLMTLAIKNRKKQLQLIIVEVQRQEEIRKQEEE